MKRPALQNKQFVVRSGPKSFRNFRETSPWAQLLEARMNQSWFSENFNYYLLTAKGGFSQG